VVVAAIGFLIVSGALGVFQMALILGAPLGHMAWGGQHRVLPCGLRAGSAVAIFLYGLFVVVVFEEAAVTDVLPDAMVGVAVWALAGYLALGVAMNAVSRSRAERLVMTPVAALMLGLVLVVALG